LKLALTCTFRVAKATYDAAEVAAAVSIAAAAAAVISA